MIPLYLLTVPKRQTNQPHSFSHQSKICFTKVRFLPPMKTHLY